MRVFHFLPLYLMFLPLTIFGQLDGFLSSQNAAQMGNHIDLNWSIALGNTCLGTTVERSVNDGPFTEIYGIGGICGSPDREEVYRYRDENLTESGKYIYRLSFGNLGFVLLTVFFVEVWESGLAVIPNTGEKGHTLRVENFSGDYQVEIYHMSGALMFSQYIRGQREISIPSNSWQTGTYIVIVRSGNTVVNEKFAVYR